MDTNVTGRVNVGLFCIFLRKTTGGLAFALGQSSSVLVACGPQEVIFVRSLYLFKIKKEKEIFIKVVLKVKSNTRSCLSTTVINFFDPLEMLTTVY